MKRRWLYPLMVIVIAVLTVSLILLCFRYDNKYTWRGVHAESGVLTLNEQTLKTQTVMFLIGGWELYRDKLLTPADFSVHLPATNAPSRAAAFLPLHGKDPEPDEYVFIGQYGGFENPDMTGSPHGSATYRLNIELPADERSYMLELPEVFSAYRLYINGRLFEQFGEPEPSAYRPETGNSTVVFSAEEHIQILFAVSDFSHFYSGMVYPPAFGVPEDVSRLLSVRFAFRMLICVTALTIGVLSLLLGALQYNIGNRSKETRLFIGYALLCLLFIGHTCYPIVKTLTRGGLMWYTIEHFCYVAMLSGVILLQVRLTGNIKQAKPFLLFGGVMCVLALISAVFVPGRLSLMLAYSNLIAFYKYAAAFYLSVSAARAAYKNQGPSKILLTGVIVFDCALIMDRLLPLYEPILFGWFTELAGFCLIMSMGTALGVSIAEQYRARIEADERAYGATILLDMQRAYFPMIEERINEVKAARHDLRHHLAVVGGFVSRGEYERLSEYTETLQDGHDMPFTYCEHDAANVVLHHFASKARENGVETTIKTDIPPDIDILDADLCALLSNLLENALEACARVPESRRRLNAAAAQRDNELVVEVRNSFDGFIEESNGGFLSRKQPKREGTGLVSVRAIAHKYGGSVQLEFEREKGVFLCSVLLKLKRGDADV